MLKRLIQGVGANFLGQTINLASRVLLVPLFLTAWGAPVYGEWLLLSSIVAYLSLTDLGGQLYIVNRLTQAYAQQDLPLFRKILHTGLGLFLILPLAVFVVFLIVILYSLPVPYCKSRSPAPAGLPGPGHPGLPVHLLPAPGHFAGGLPGRGAAAPGGDARQPHAIGQRHPGGPGLWLQAGLAAIAGLQLLPFLGIALAAGWDLNRRFPQFRVLSLRDADVSCGLTFIKPSLQFFAIQLSQPFPCRGPSW